MKRKKRKALRTKLLTEIKSVIKQNKLSLSNKIEKALEESVRKLVKKADLKKISVPTGKKKPVLYSDKSKLDGVSIAPSRQIAN
jgi:L-lactate utilization protein LutC